MTQVVIEQINIMLSKINDIKFKNKLSTEQIQKKINQYINE